LKKVDYIIIGLGLAGIAFCEELERAGKTFVAYDSGVEGASRVAAGLYNPVILKRYTLPWKAVEQFDLAIPHYKNLEQKLSVSFMNPMPVCKVFSSVEDQNNWFSASDKPLLERFVSPRIQSNTNDFVTAPDGFGEVLETGRVAIKKLQKAYQDYLEKKKAFAKLKFVYSNITFKGDNVIYDGYESKRIVFAEGYGVKQNPYFSALPLVGNKGEYLIIKAPDLQLNAALKTSFFIVPLGDALYKVGATFNWTDKDTQPSNEARKELIEKLATLISCDYEIIDQEVGIRPTTGDRRALLGVHPKFKQLALLNGLGTRGIMASPLLAKYLFNFLEKGEPLPAEVDIMRFPKKF
jgi:glycine/D-amino acid oxidase-like deaminating enzyme